MALRTLPLFRTDSHILPPLHSLSNPPTHTSTVGVLGRTPSNLGVELKADASTFKYERHRACLSVNTSTDEPSYEPPTRTHLAGRRSVELMKLSLKPVRASRAEGFQGPYGGSQSVRTLYRIYIFCFQMCNRLPEMMKNGDTEIFPLYYSLKAAVYIK